VIVIIRACDTKVGWPIVDIFLLTDVYKYRQNKRIRPEDEPFCAGGPFANGPYNAETENPTR
jgi:hypothetical protein